MIMKMLVKRSLDLPKSAFAEMKNLRTAKMKLMISWSHLKMTAVAPVSIQASNCIQDHE